MRQKKMMLLLVGVLVVLAILYGGLRIWNQKSEEKEAEQAEAEKVYLVDEDEFSAVSYTNGADEMRLMKEEDIWYYEQDTEIPISQDTVEGIVSAIQELTANRELEDPDDLADYGLEEPSYTIRYTGDSGEESALYIGNTVNGDYYATVNDTGNVYTIPSTLISSLQFDLSGLVENDAVPSIGSGNLKKVEITQDQETVTYEEEEELAELAGGFGVLTLSDCVNYHAEEEDLAEYGLDEENRITATAIYTDSESEDDETFTVYIGDIEESDTYQYIMVKDSKMIYQVSKEIIENMTVADGEEE